MTGASPAPAPHRVVVVGGGFGGLAAVRALRRERDVAVTLVDRRNFHLFAPLLYQVATGALSTDEIAAPLRGVLKRQRNVRVVMAEVTGFDLDRREVRLEGLDPLGYDSLVVAAGTTDAYFGHDEWRPFAPGLKTIEDAVELRRRILLAFEAAELEHDPDRRRAWLTFVCVGGGPTGVEMAGQIIEIARDSVRRDFRSIDPKEARVVIVDMAPRVLAAYSERLSASAERQLTAMGVEVRTETGVTGIDATGVDVRPSFARHAEIEHLPARTVVWAAGVAASPLARALSQAGAGRLAGGGRLHVAGSLSPPGHPEVFVIGDMVSAAGTAGTPLPGVAPVAMQQGRYAAARIRHRLARRRAGRDPLLGAGEPTFRYRDKGSLATIGRGKAVGYVFGRPLTGAIAWLGWLTIHLTYLVGFQNRLLVFIRWAGSYITRGRGGRVILGAETAAEIHAGEPERRAVG